jgi:type IV pilus assembly protein PilE
MTMYFTRSPLRRGRGFTLLELLVAVVIVGILTAIALPSYKAHIVKGKRAAAQAQMMDIANREEQFLLANRAYADKATLTTSGYALPAEVASSYSYDIALDAGSVPGYTITFTAINAQLSDGNLTLTGAGVKGPAGKW